MLDLQPTLQDELVRLRPLREADRAGVHAAAADPLTWAQHPDAERWGPTFAPYFDANLASGGALAVESVSSGAVIGLTRLQILPQLPNTVEVGWTFLARPYWGGRYNAAAKRLLRAHAASANYRVVLLIAASNLRSMRAAQRVGGRRVDPLTEPALFEGKENYVAYVLDGRVGRP